jgi:hypothetical protein
VWLCSRSTHERIYFWLGRPEKLDLSSQISDTLKSAEVPMATPSRDAQILVVGVVFLSCDQLKQLHSLIHSLEREEMEQSLSEGKSSALIADDIVTNHLCFLI